MILTTNHLDHIDRIGFNAGYIFRQSAVTTFKIQISKSPWPVSQTWYCFRSSPVDLKEWDY